MVTVATDRVSHAPVEGAAELFTAEFVGYLTFLHDRFSSEVTRLAAKRMEMLERAHKGSQPAHPVASEANTGDWKVPEVPEELRMPGIEISGPASLTSMFINALNPGPDGNRAEGDLDDDEDSAGHRLADTIASARNRLGAVERTLSFYNPARDRRYTLQDGKIPFFMHRDRGLHLYEPEVTIDGDPVSAAILGTALTLFYAGRAQIERGQGVYFYLPKLETAEEAGFWRDFFDASREYLKLPSDAVIKAIVLVESLPIVYEMEETLHALGPYAAGLNAARWDLKASILEYVMADPASVWPDRFGVDIKTTDFIANIFRRLVAICLKRDAVPIGGMATALPSRDDEVNRVAAASIKADKEWEARQGFLRGWVAHIYHMKTAADPFKEWWGSGWKPTPEMCDPDNYPVQIEVPDGPITVEGTRRNTRTLIEYVEGWLNGRGAKGIDSLDGKPGIHPALMEDLATARISVAQTAQRVIHAARDTETGEVHDTALVKRLLQEDVEDILARLKSTVNESDEKSRSAFAAAEERYRKAVKIAMHWTRSYIELDFRSLGSYTRADLDAIAAAPDAL
jgi:malate synthase